jgi:acyl-CoA thioesterase I
MQNPNPRLRRRAASVALSAFCLWAATALVVPSLANSNPLAAKKPAPSVGEERVILIMGDSLSAEYGLGRGTGWVSLLQAELTGLAGPNPAAPYRIQNASISGETSSGGMSRLADQLTKFKPKIVIIELGGNDALRGLKLESTESNLRTMTQRAQMAGAQVLILGMQIPPNFGKAYAEQFSDVFVKVARSEKVKLLPFFLDGIADDLKMFQADRIHPSQAAQPRMMQNVLLALRPLLGRR